MCCEIPGLHAHEIAALRRAAAMAHTVAGIALTLRSGGRPLASVMPGAEPAGVHPTRSIPILSPCGFRNAVAKAWTDHERGQRVALIGQDRCGLEVEWSLRQPGAMLGFGGVRTQWAGRVIWAMASLLPPETLAEALDDARDEPRGALLVADALEARMIRDDLLEVSIVHVEAEHVSPALVAAVDEVIRHFVATTAAAELIGSLSPV
jgi:hypothetical protein